jgi:SLOG-like protein
MPAIDTNHFDQLAYSLEQRFPPGPRVAILGSTDFWHPDSERTCAELGRLLASIDGLVLLTGGVEGIGEAVGRSFFQTRVTAQLAASVFHVLPIGEDAWDYGETFFAGSDMSERREVLGRLAKVFVLVEGGPRSEHEVNVALAHGATVIPVGRSGGFAATAYYRGERPDTISSTTWEILGANSSTPEATALAALHATQSCLLKQQIPSG